eukprot:CAMPEP_0118851182 /NCGR_PEP_ID=MMETSP1163-20130328/717_1 /TAXON_ID=124430 /ORGANISM="Phaeomonas parva, Strain CCMP2877" /LENGTH=270 /DNA_ID=CAMNT_0006783473 /DNA_START=130 /DNA_END=942 /DNA_ORIENTATION=+
MIYRLVALAALAAGAQGFSARRPMRMNLGVVQQVHAHCLGTIGERLGLEGSDYTQSLGMQSFNAGGVQGSADWLKEASPKYLTGVSTSSVTANGKTTMTIEAWMGPSYEVPHMTLKLASAGDMCEITADYISRNDIAYCAESYREDHYGADVMAWWAKGASAGPALPPSTAFGGRLLRSPAELSVQLADANLMGDLAVEHVNRWLNWLVDAEPLIARKRGAMNSRDDALRRFAFAGNVASCVAMAGEDAGRSIAAAITGPVSEAYVGGAS